MSAQSVKARIHLKALELTAGLDEETRRLDCLREIKHQIIGSDSKKQAFIVADILSKLAHILSTDPNEEIVEAIFIILASVATSNADLCHSIIQQKDFTVWLKYFSSENKKMFVSVCRFTRAVCSAAPASSSKLDLAQICSQLMVRLGDKDSETVHSALACLSQMTRDINTISPVIIEELIQRVVPFLSSKSPKSQVYSIQVLYNLSQVSSSVKQYFSENEHESSILSSFLKSEDMNTRTIAMKCLLSFSPSFFQSKNKGLYVSMITSISKNFKDGNRGVPEDILECLNTLLELGSDIQKSCFEAGFVVKLMKLISSNQSQVSKIAISSDNQNSPGHRIISLQCLSKLLFHSEESRTQAFQHKILPIIEESIISPNIHVRIESLGCLLALSRSSRLWRATIGGSSSFPKLLEGFYDANTHVQAYCYKIVANLLLENGMLKHLICQGPYLKFSIDTLATSELLPSYILFFLKSLAFDSAELEKKSLMDHLSMEILTKCVEHGSFETKIYALYILQNITCSSPDHDGAFLLMSKTEGRIIDLVKKLATQESDGPNQESITLETLHLLQNMCSITPERSKYITGEDIYSMVAPFLQHHNANIRLASATCVSNFLWPNAMDNRQKIGQFKVPEFLAVVEKLMTDGDDRVQQKAKIISIRLDLV